MGKRDRPVRSKRREGGWRSKRPQDLLKKIREAEKREHNLANIHWEATKELSQVQKTLHTLEKKIVQERGQYEARARMYKDAIHALACCVETCRVAVEDVQLSSPKLSLQEMFMRQKKALDEVQKAIAELENTRLLKIQDVQK